MDCTILTISCSPTPILAVHKINKKSGSLGLKNRFSRSDLPIWSDFENYDYKQTRSKFLDITIHKSVEPCLAMNSIHPFLDSITSLLQLSTCQFRCGLHQNYLQSRPNPLWWNLYWVLLGCTKPPPILTSTPTRFVMSSIHFLAWVSKFRLIRASFQCRPLST